jgi:broad specificity phosphatase PhoE
MSDQNEKIIYFVRHGQSVDNPLPIFQGVNSPLSDVGKKQAELIADRIGNIDFDVLISSPVLRARQTAEIIKNNIDKELEYSDLFVERIKPSSVVDKSNDDLEAKKTFLEWKNSLYTSGLRIEDGENFDDLISRADKALDFLEKRSENKIVVITHGYFLKTILARVVLGDTLSPESFKNFQLRIWTENTGLSVIKYNILNDISPWTLWIYNDHAHLG